MGMNKNRNRVVNNSAEKEDGNGRESNWPLSGRVHTPTCHVGHPPLVSHHTNWGQKEKEEEEEEEKEEKEEEKNQSIRMKPWINQRFSLISFHCNGPERETLDIWNLFIQISYRIVGKVRLMLFN